VVGATIMVTRIASGEIEDAKAKFYLDFYDR
jgi:hypothetical protein